MELKESFLVYYQKEIELCKNLKVGDTFTIRKDIKVCRRTDVVEEMVTYAGQSDIIKKISPLSNGVLRFYLKDIKYCWYSFQADYAVMSPKLGNYVFSNSELSIIPSLPDI